MSEKMHQHQQYETSVIDIVFFDTFSKYFWLLQKQMLQSGCIDLGISKFEFMAKTQFL